MADNEDDLVDYDEEEVRRQPPMEASTDPTAMDPLELKIQGYLRRSTLLVECCISRHCVLRL
jgi:hypothetical protein